VSRVCCKRWTDLELEEGEALGGPRWVRDLEGNLALSIPLDTLQDSINNARLIRILLRHSYWVNGEDPE